MLRFLLKLDPKFGEVFKKLKFSKQEKPKVTMKNLEVFSLGNRLVEFNEDMMERRPQIMKS